VHLPEEELDAYLQSVELRPLSSNTITMPERLRADIVKIRHRGFSIDIEELSLGQPSA
jgi:DNA-binding IclR family transcriptional regulator